MENLLKENEVIDDLELNELKIIQNENYFKFGIDAVLISDFAKGIKKNSVVMDIGTGTGIIPILLSAKTSAQKIYGVEIQEQVADMAKRSVEMNGLGEKVEIINKDIKNIGEFLQDESIDVIVTNPPYYKVDSGIINECEELKISRHEVFCNIEDICEIAKKLLKNNGEFYMVHRPERMVDIIYNLRKNNIEPKEIRYVHSYQNKKPVLILIKAVKNGNPFLKTLEPLIVYDEEGNYTKEVLQIYGKEV